MLRVCLLFARAGSPIRGKWGGAWRTQVFSIHGTTRLRAVRGKTEMHIENVKKGNGIQTGMSWPVTGLGVGLTSALFFNTLSSFSVQSVTFFTTGINIVLTNEHRVCVD